MPEAKLIKKTLTYVVESSQTEAEVQAKIMCTLMDKYVYEGWKLGKIYSYTTPSGKTMTKFELYVTYPGYQQKDVDDEAK